MNTSVLGAPLRFALVWCALTALVSSCGLGSKSNEDRARSSHDPARVRAPAGSTSLSLAADWRPPAPTRTRAAGPARRSTTPVSHGFVPAPLSSSASDEDVRGALMFSEPLLPVPGTSSRAERSALAHAINAYASTGGAGETAALEAFVTTFPSSRWNPGLLLNMGIAAYQTGHFSKALDFWWRSFELAEAGTDRISKRIANRAVAEYAKMNARIGRRHELDRVFDRIKSRDFEGSARVTLENAVEGRAVMEKKPGVAFRCGPYALVNIAPLLGQADSPRIGDFLRRVQSPREGFSLNEVFAQSEELGLELQMAFRSPGASIITPAVVHWAVGHYAALVETRDGYVHTKDPTFGNDTWLRESTLDAEASGYFLVPAGPLPTGWRTASAEEAAEVFGKGHSGNGDPDGTGPDDPQTPPDGGGGGPGGPGDGTPGGGPGGGPGGDGEPESGGEGDCGGDIAMARYRVHLMLSSLSVYDVPVRYRPAFGPPITVRVRYNQREAGQPTTIAFTNFSPSWVSNWISYIEDTPASPNANVKLRRRGGGGETHKNYNSGSGTYDQQAKTGAVLHKLTSNTYKKVHRDGTVEFYEQYIGTTGSPRRVFLSRVVDRQGKELVIDYDSTYPSRIEQVIDATGLSTLFSYEYSGEPYLVTSIEDPYGRTATFTYTEVDEVLRLQSTEDPDGIISSFSYDDDGGMVGLTTPYGTTSFELSPMIIDGGYDLIRYVEITDPYGSRERVEYNTQAALTGVPNVIAEPLPNDEIVDYYSIDNDDRNTFYWDKQQMKLAPGDHSKAQLYHWLTPNGADVATTILESQKPPLEGRIWYNYPGQTQPYIMGTLASPSVVARVVEDAEKTQHTQAYLYEYNSLGNRTKRTDPLGRETVTVYAANDVDVVEVKQKVGESTYETLVSYTYEETDPPHLPSTMIDAAGEVTDFTYSSTTGQLLEIENALGQIITFTYGEDDEETSYRRLVSITGDVPGGSRTFTYDDYGRVRTVTDSESYTLTYDYDDLDRVRVVTYPDESFTQYEYEDHSLVASKDRAGRWTRHAYNALRERVVTRDPIGRTVQQQWCRCGQLRRLVDGEGNITEWVRDEQGRVVEKVFADDSKTLFTYDYSGRLLTETDALDRTKTFEYTLDDRLSKVDYEDSGTPDVEYSYDPWYGRVTEREDGVGTTTYVYNDNDGETLGAGQVALIDGPFTDDTLKYTYDELGRVAQMQIVDDTTHTTASYSEAYDFDVRGRVTEVTNDLGVFEYAYVGQTGRVSGVDYPNGMTATYDYWTQAGDHLLKQLKYLSAGGPPELLAQFDYTYAQDRTISTWRQELDGLGVKSWTFGYDGAMQLTSALAEDGSEDLVEHERYGYDKAGNRIQVITGTTAAPEVRNYKVNNLNQLVSERGFGKTLFSGTLDEPATVTVNGQPAQVTSTAGSAPYHFEAWVQMPAGTSQVVVQATDGSSNTTTQTYEVTTTGTTALFDYDLAGNMRFEREPNEDVRREYQWDQKNRLVYIAEGEHETEMVYDGATRRVRIRELEDEVEVAEHVYIWCGSRICQQREDDGETVVRNYYRQGFTAGEDTFVYVRDHLGSVQAVVADDGETFESARRYSPWGETRETAGAGEASDFGYTGHLDHGPSGVVLAQYRGYDARLGRWLSRDPMREGGGLNLHAYVGSDPIRFDDPLGLYKLAVRIGLGNQYTIWDLEPKKERKTEDGVSWQEESLLEGELTFEGVQELDPGETGCILFCVFEDEEWEAREAERRSRMNQCRNSGT